MNETTFRKWLGENGYNRKVSSDTISRLKKLEQSTNCDIEDEYKKDCFTYLFSLFENKGENEKMLSLSNNELPIGKYYLCAYKYALNIYLKFKKEGQNG